ncbi:hypothetical protein [Sulfuracidifex metallicus]|uniref:hypothetical protein n=1 Tax=Sulfuracidifex metallicus TaxID=47303 RepID=UPI0022740F57|nr:hypothetical protein [Sulfuracidifex metallicus]MCY0850356.1 hypothetical protein [Sulfuracidifex metallicus]
MYILTVVALVMAGITIQELLLRFANTPLKILTLVLFSGLASIAGFALIIVEEYLLLPIYGIYVISFFLPAFLTVYLNNYYKFFKQAEFLGLMLVLFTMFSFVGSVIIVPSTLYSIQHDSPGICDPSGFPYFSDLATMVQNYSLAQEQININLGEYTNLADQVHAELLTYLNDINEVKNYFNSTLFLLHEGKVNEARSSYSEMLLAYNNMTSAEQNLLYNSNLLYNDIGGSSYSLFTYNLNKLQISISSEVNYVEDIMSYALKDSSSAYVPVSINLSHVSLDFGKVNTIKGNLTSSFGTPSGEVIIYHGNSSVKVPLINGAFNFNVNLTQYTITYPITVVYPGNEKFLPNITSFTIPTNVIITRATFNVTPKGIYPGESVTIQGNVSGNLRTMIVSIDNVSKTFTVTHNYTVEFTLPLNMTNETYLLNVTFLPDGYYSPLTKLYPIIPILHKLNVSLSLPSVWIIPSSITLTGHVSYSQKLANVTKVYVFVDSQRYSATVDGGKFSLTIKPKLSLIYGKQKVIVEVVPQYGYYKEITSATTTLYNPIWAVLIALIAILYYLLFIRRNRGLKRAYLEEKNVGDKLG